MKAKYTFLTDYTAVSITCKIHDIFSPSSKAYNISIATSHTKQTKFSGPAIEPALSCDVVVGWKVYAASRRTHPEHNIWTQSMSKFLPQIESGRWR